MKRINPGMIQNIFSNCPTVATCWFIELRNGTALRFTDCDRDLVIAGTTYKAATGFLRSNTETDKELSVNSLELESVIDDESITVEGIAKGLYDDAKVTIFLVDYTNLTSAPDDTIELLRGTLGQIVHTGDTYKAEGRSLTDQLSLQYSSVTSTLCQHSFCDAEDVPFTACRLNRTNFEYERTIQDASDDRFNFEYSPDFSSSMFKYGIAEFITGPNAGFKSTIADDNGRGFTLYVPTPFLSQIGDRVRLLRGCDKTLATCRNYNNSINFGGFPFIPIGNPYQTRVV